MRESERVSKTGRAGFLAHEKMEVGGGCFSARVGGRVAIVARVSLPTRLDARF